MNTTLTYGVLDLRETVATETFHATQDYSIPMLRFSLTLRALN